MFTTNFHCKDVSSHTTYPPAEAEVKASNEHSCLSLFIPTFHKHTPVSHDTQRLIESRRVEVKNHITQRDYLFTQLYFLAHQHQVQCISKDDWMKLVRVFIEASYLDENITSIIACLKQFVETLPNEKQTLFSTIVTSLQASLPLAYLISTLSESTEDVQSSIVEQLNVLLFQQYQHLPVGAQMLIPAGYLTGDNYDLTRKGHAVLLELTKLDERKVTLRVFNTSEGLNYHKKKDAMFYPFIIENIEGSLIDRDFFAKLSALGCQKKHTKTNEIDDLYYLLVWKFGFQKRYHKSTDSQYFDQGLANSCAHQSVMAWIKNSLGEERADLFGDFMNYLVRDRMKMMMESTDKQKNDVYIKKPYVVYSLTIQKSLTLTLAGAAKRVFSGSTVYEKVKSAQIDNLTAYVTKHFEQNHGFKTPRNEDYLKYTNQSDDSTLIEIREGQTSISFDELQKLRSLGCLAEALNDEGIANFLKDNNYLFNAQDLVVLRKLKPFPFSILKNKLIAGTLSLKQVIKLESEYRGNKQFWSLGFGCQELVVAGYLPIQSAISLSEEKRQILGGFAISHLISNGNLDMKDALSLSMEEAEKISQVYKCVRSNILSWQTAITLTANQLSIVREDDVCKLIKLGKISLEEAFSLNQVQMAWITHNGVLSLIEADCVDWKKVIQLDRSEADFFDKAITMMQYNEISFDEYFDKKHRNYHLLPGTRK